jgi:hypothetical protein
MVEAACRRALDDLSLHLTKARTAVFAGVVFTNNHHRCALHYLHEQPGLHPKPDDMPLPPWATKILALLPGP